MVAWFIPILISVALSVISYLLAPKPKQPKPEAAKEMESPTSEAGRPISVPFGTIMIKSPNALHSGDKSMRQYEVEA